MWIVMHIARGKEACARIREALEREGVLVKVKPLYKSASEADNEYQICVLKSESGQARSILIRMGL